MSNQRIKRAWPGVLVLILLLSACQTHETHHTIEMTRSDTFYPASLVVPQGATVVWQNLDHEVHASVTRPELALHSREVVDESFDSSWNSGDILPGGTWARTFLQEGTYLYFCPYHEEMLGSIVVGNREVEEGSTRWLILYP